MKDKSRNKSIKMVAAFAAVLFALIGTTVSAYAADKPNIMFIMGDDIGIMNVAAYHQGLMVGETPNIDSLANEGG